MLMPWPGMFEQVALCDRFVCYDDVQLPLGGGRGRGFITRVQIKTARGVEWLSLPVERANAGKQRICDARLAHQDWRAQHLGKIAQAYRAAPFRRWADEHVIQPIYALETASVAEFCLHSMRVIARALGLPFEPQRSSAMDLERRGSASECVLEICRRFGASEYLSGLGAMDYIDYGLFERAGVRICYMAYGLARYPQLHGAFTPYVSAIDLLCNTGPDAARHLRPRSVYWKEWPAMAAGRPVRAGAAGTTSEEA
jgi:hypothetical protein